MLGMRDCEHEAYLRRMYNFVGSYNGRRSGKVAAMNGASGSSGTVTLTAAQSVTFKVKSGRCVQSDKVPDIVMLGDFMHTETYYCRYVLTTTDGSVIRHQPGYKEACVVFGSWEGVAAWAHKQAIHPTTSKFEVYDFCSDECLISLNWK